MNFLKLVCESNTLLQSNFKSSHNTCVESKYKVLYYSDEYKLYMQRYVSNALHTRSCTNNERNIYTKIN